MEYDNRRTKKLPIREDYFSTPHFYSCYGGIIIMSLYYLTEMNLLKLENTILKFIHNNHIEQTLTNGIIGKISAMMYQKKIDYYYPDCLATTLNVDIKHVDTVYLYGHDNIYDKTLETLLNECDLYNGNLNEANQLEKDINKILQTKKPIKCKKILRKHYEGEKIT